MKRCLAVAVAVLSLLLAGCTQGSPPPEGLTDEQCDRFVPLTEDYFLVYVKDGWQFSAESPTAALSAVQRVAGDINDAADQLETPSTMAAVQRVRDAYSAAVLLAESYLDEPLTVGDPAAVADQRRVTDGIDESLADCRDR